MNRFNNHKTQGEPVISENIRLRYPDQFEIGEGSIIDDFCYLSAQIRIGRHCHIASGCTVGGGTRYLFSLGDYSGLSCGVNIWCTSNDFTRDMITIIPEEFAVTTNATAGDVIFERYTGVGSNSVIMPNNHIAEGSVIGSLSFVPPDFQFKPWTIYTGNPIRPIGMRDRDSVLRQVEEFEIALARRDDHEHAVLKHQKRKREGTAI